MQAKLIYEAKIDNTNIGLSPALEVSELTLGRFYREFDSAGENNIIPDFNLIYADMLKLLRPLSQQSYEDYNQVMLKDIPLPSPEQIHKMLLKEEEDDNN